MSWQVRVVGNRYVDSVRLMQVAQQLREHDGVTACEVLMGTPANLEALAALGADCSASPTDVVIAVDGAADALDAAERALADSAAAPTAAEEAQARTLPAAARRLADANVAVISVPGD
jgi:FdrA protein